MKANRKFVEGEEAVSAVIGVILMVAITVAIAATVYVYVSGMLSPVPTAAPSITGVLSTTDGNITITLSGEYIDGTDTRITVTAWNNTVWSFEPPVTEASLGKVAGGKATIMWIDASADGDVGSGDIIKVQNTSAITTGLTHGDWFVKIIQISSGKAAYDSSAIEIK